MSDVETSTLVKALIAILVLVVMAILIYTALNFDDVKQIAKEVFHVDSQEELNTKTEDSVSDFSSDLDACNNGEYNPDSKDNCFCFQSIHSDIQEGSYISIQNADSTSTSQFTTLTENGEPLLQFTKSFKLGLMATSKSGDNYQLGCVFPSQYFIIGKDDDLNLWSPFEDRIDNNWYVKWIDERLSFLNPLEDDYTFGFYRDDSSSSLSSAPMLYRIDSTHYCLVTKLIDEPIEYSSSEFIPLSDNLQRIGDDPRVFDEPDETVYTSIVSKASYYASVQTFLINDEKLCNKL